MIIKRNEEFDLAYRFVTETNLNIFLTGKAGTGKTTFLKYLRETSIKNMVVAAPTGVAAINARGVTLHSLFQLPFGIVLPESQSFHGNSESIRSHPLLSKIRYSSEKLSLLRSMELLVIDEASMVASYTVDAIDTILRYVKRRSFEPFGGTQILFIGDLHQLPPVIKNEDWEILRDFYSSVFFFDSFVLRENVPVTIELKEIFRQKDDSFIEILNGIRNNNITEENYRLLNSRLKKSFIPPDDGEYITLTTHNYQSDEINKRKLSKLTGSSHFFNADVIDEFPEHIFPAEKELRLKVGAQVMFLKNDTEEKKYFNGKIGIITALDKSSIRVKCKEDFDEIEVKKCEWQNIKYTMNPDTREIIEDVIGSFVQYPLRLAWAITIHKSQGLTFERLVIDAEKAFATGQVYVALSRCTSLEGLVLVSPVNQRFLGAHRDLRAWQDKNSGVKNLSQLFIDSRQKYSLHELQNVFTWKSWYYELKDLNELVIENQEKLPADSIPWITGLMQKQKELYEVSEKFKEIIVRLSKEKSFIEENDLLQNRLKDGANYFSNEISKWNEKFYNHPLSVDTKKISRKLDSALDEINFMIHEILHKINYCKNGFSLDGYLKSGKSFTGVVKKNPGSYAQNKAAVISEEITHAELYGRLNNMRNRIADKSGLPLYMIFSNSAIKNVCLYLPLSKEALLHVKGFGKVKVKEYGDEIISLVQEYCNENDFEPSRIDITQRASTVKKETKKPTVLVTVHYLKEGKNIEEIAMERSLAVSTIESHLAQAVEENLIAIEELMPMDDVQKIAELFPENLDDVRLTPIKEKAPPEISYGQLRMVLAWLKKEKENSLKISQP